MTIVGAPLSRTDGLLKVTGGARYAAEFARPDVAHAVLVTSTIASGRIAAIDTQAAEGMTGVITVMTWRNALRLPQGGHAGANSPPAGRVLSLLQDDRVQYQNEPVAVVVADTFERAVDAAHAVKVRYRENTASLDFEGGKAGAVPSKGGPGGPGDSLRGDVAAGAAAGAVHVDVRYTTPIEHHNPMEPHATLAAWDGDHLTLYDSTQYVSGVRETVSKSLGISPDNVRVICPYVGGGFGCKGSTWSHVVLAAMAARQAGRPVKLVLDRQQMFGPVGSRPHTEQHLQLAAHQDGRLTSMTHDVWSNTSTLEDWSETSAVLSRMLYAVPNQSTSHRLVRLNLGTPTFMRAPGETTGSFALESTLDELATQLGVDPIDLRLRNYAQNNPEDGKPFSSKSLKQCYEQGAERFGWSRRQAPPRSMRDGHTLIGMGMATATYPAQRSAASALARLLPDGSAQVASGTQDLGTGTYTVMTQVAADALGYPVERVHFALGDTTLPRAPVSGGSQSVASVSPAVQAACEAVRAKLIDTAVGDSASPLAGAPREQIVVENGWLSVLGDTQRRESASAILARAGGRPLEATVHVQPGDERKTHAFHSFGAVFAEVGVDEDLGIVRVRRVVARYGIGRLLNAKTGHSQLMGGVVWGIGAALLEVTEADPRSGRFVNGNLADYHVPVNADVQEIDVAVVEEDDPFINSLGAKGIGEIGITGVVAAIANAVYHATGVRVRDLPITPDKLLRA
ncbi:MAG: xanthine dehydrogenase family protein molybdopterin-binding subunit [Janthinobacterium lividum]